MNLFFSPVSPINSPKPPTSAPAVASGARGLKKPKGFVPTAPVYNFSAVQRARAADAVDWRLTEAVTPIKNQGAWEDWELDHPTDLFVTDHPNGLVEACQISPPDSPFIHLYIYMICIMYITCYNILLHFITCMIIINSCDSLQGNHPRVRRRNKPAMWMIWMISEGAQGPIWLFNFSAIHWEPRSYQEFSNHT